MAEQKALYIDGNWVTTADTVVNTNPSDTNDVIGEYAQASSEHVNNALAAANRAVGARQHKLASTAKRKEPVVTAGEPRAGAASTTLGCMFLVWKY